jgi:hypothetical protein
MRHTAAFILLIFCLIGIKAQSTDTLFSYKSYFVSLYSGYAGYIERDDVMSPFKFRGQTLPVELSYRYFGTINRQIFYAGFDNLRLISSLPDYDNAGLNHYVKNTNIQMGYSFIRRALRLVKFQSELYIGGELNSLINLRQHAFIDNNEFVMLDQVNSFGLKAQLEKRFVNNRQTAFASLSIPIVSYVLMGDTYNAFVGKKTDPLMDYSGNMLLYLAKKGDFVSFNKLVYFKTEVTFVQGISKHIGIECKYSLRYYKFCQYTNINYSKNLQSQVIIGLTGKL